MVEKIHSDVRSVLEGWIEKHELPKLSELTEKIKNLSSIEQEAFIKEPIISEIIAAIESHKWESKRALMDLKNQLEKYSNQNQLSEVSHTSQSFSHLQEEFSSYIGTSKAMAAFKDQFHAAIDKRFSWVFPKKVQDTMMLPIWEEWIGHIDNVGKIAAETVTNMFSLQFKWSEATKEKVNGLLAQLFEKTEQFLQNSQNIQNDHPEINLENPQVLNALYNWEIDHKKLIILSQADTNYYKSVQEKTKIFTQKVWDFKLSIWGVFEKVLWENSGEKISTYLKENSWLVLILNLFGLWGLIEKYTDTTEQKRYVSIQKLGELWSDSSSVIASAPKWFFKDFDIKKLDSFYDYLDTQKIDYSKESFWKELLSGKSQNSKIKNMHTLLSQESKDILSKDDFKDWWKGMIQKLSSISELEHRAESQEIEKEKTNIITALPVIAATMPEWNNISLQREDISQKEPSHIHPNPNKQDVPKQPVDKAAVNVAPKSEASNISTPEVLKSFTHYRDIEIREALSKATSFPVKISYEKQRELDTLWIPSPKSIDFKNEKIIIDDKKFLIKFDGVSHISATIESISLQDAQLKTDGLQLTLLGEWSETYPVIWEIQWEKEEKVTITKNETFEIIHGLIATWKFIKDIPISWNITWWKISIT